MRNTAARPRPLIVSWRGQPEIAVDPAARHRRHRSFVQPRDQSVAEGNVVDRLRFQPHHFHRGFVDPDRAAEFLGDAALPGLRHRARLRREGHHDRRDALVQRAALDLELKRSDNVGNAALTALGGALRLPVAAAPGIRLLGGQPLKHFGRPLLVFPILFCQFL